MYTYTIHAHLIRPVNDGEETFTVACVNVTTTQDWTPGTPETERKVDAMVRGMFDHLAEHGDYAGTLIQVDDPRELVDEIEEAMKQ